MNSRERVIAAIEYKKPDRMPLMLAGIGFSQLSAYPESLFPNDIFHDGPGFYEEGCLPGRNMDNWGCEWLNLKPPSLGQVIGHPLKDDAALDSYQPPAAEDLDLSGARYMGENRGDKYFVLGYISLFERLINLRGFEDLLIDIAIDQEYVIRMRDMVLNYNLKLIDRLLELNPDAVYLADDWGSQISLMISPASWRKLFLPAYRKMIDKIKNAGAHIFFHSDGYVLDILPDLIEAGVNVFWVEFGVNPLNLLRQAAHGKSAYLALYDTQAVELDTEEAMIEHIRRCVEMFNSADGGFIAQYYLGEGEQEYRYVEHGLRILEFYKEIINATT